MVPTKTTSTGMVAKHAEGILRKEGGATTTKSIGMSVERAKDACCAM